MTGKNKEFFTNDILSLLVSEIGIAFWVWDAIEDNVFYNSSFSKLVGMSESSETFTVNTWQKMVHPDDRELANKNLSDYMEGRCDHYSVELRIIKEDGDIMWLLDNGKATKYDENGNILHLSGITQDITKRKMYEHQLTKEEDKLKVAMQFASFSVWEWNVNTNIVICDKGYAKSLGYDDEEWFTSIERWLTIMHPDDALKVKQVINKCISGEQKSYDHKLRIRKSNGEFIWVRDIGEISKFDENGKAIQLIGGRIDINELELATLQLESYQDDLEEQIQKRKCELIQRDKTLLELNKISQQLMATPTGEYFKEIAYEYLEEFTNIQNVSRLAIFRNKFVDEKIICYLDNEPKSGYRTKFTINYIRDVFKDVSIEFLSEGAFKEEQREDFYNILLEKTQHLDLNNLDYEIDFPFIYKAVKENKIINLNTKDLPAKEFLFTCLQGIKTIMMSPIVVNNIFWGFIMLDDYENKEFTQEDEKTLTLLGSVIAQAIHKNDLQLIADKAVEHNALMLDALPICCNLWDGFKCIYTNVAALKLFNLKEPEEFYEKFHLFNPEYQPSGERSDILIAQNMNKAIEEKYNRFEWLHVDLEGNPLPCEITLVKVRYGNKDLVAGYARDLREVKELLKNIEETQEDLKQAHEEALLSSQAKSNFLANMSHEIRTPMNAISGMTDIILRESGDREVNEYADNIKRACDSLLSIINDVLDISKIESGKLDIVEGEYYLSNVLNDVLTIASNRLELKPLMFTTNFQADLPEVIIGDDIRIKQIMVNILNNAIKFTTEGSISFDVWGDYAGGLLQLKFSVTDTGSGISKEDIEKLFIEFERVDTKKNRNIEGTGLGLAISKRLCEMMDGQIEVESELGVGTKFTVTVLQKYEEYSPIAKVENNNSLLVFESREVYSKSIKQACESLDLNTVVYCTLQSELNDALQEKNFDFIFTSSIYLLKVQEMVLKYNYKSKVVLLADNADIKSRYDIPTIVIPANSISISNILNGKSAHNDSAYSSSNFTAPSCHILVVDDNLVNLKVAQGLMRPYQFKISTAENGQEAVEKVKKNQYDMIFMDHMMPIMDGIDATIAIRALEDEYYKNIPIIALTANAIIGTKEMFISEGMNDFLAKPIKLSSLNDILAKWLPKDKQLIDNEKDDCDENENEIILSIPNVDTDLGIKRIGGDFETYIDILNMYYKDGLKRIPNIRNMFDNKQTLEFKIEVHALKSASASVGAIDVSEKARLLEEAAIKDDWVYIDDNTIRFIDDFNILLENIRESLKGLISDPHAENKIPGDDTFFVETLTALSEALDIFEINKCDELLASLFEYSWGEEQFEKLLKIKEFVDGYEYDNAVEIIESIV